MGDTNLRHYRKLIPDQCPVCEAELDDKAGTKKISILLSRKNLPGVPGMKYMRFPVLRRDAGLRCLLSLVAILLRVP